MTPTSKKAKVRKVKAYGGFVCGDLEEVSMSEEKLEQDYAHIYPVTITYEIPIRKK